jgi:rubrerythrin
MANDEVKIIRVLCCNRCGREIQVEEQPDKCPACGHDFEHGWDALSLTEPTP